MGDKGQASSRIICCAGLGSERGLDLARFGIPHPFEVYWYRPMVLTQRAIDTLFTSTTYHSHIESMCWIYDEKRWQCY